VTPDTGVESVPEKDETPAIPAASELPGIEPVPFGPLGIPEGILFAEKSPVFRFGPVPADGVVEVQVSTDREFPEGTLIYKGESETGVLKIDIPLETGKTYFLRGRVAGPAAGPEAFSEPVRFGYSPLDHPAMLPVVKPGTTAEFTMGNNRGLARERPERKVTITRPYDLGVFPVTNAMLAEVVNRFIAIGEAAVIEGDIRDKNGVPLIGIRTMNYGSQFGLEIKEDRIVPKPGRASHPAVGLTWHGAAALCNALSVLFGYEQVYDPQGGADLEADGFRLPTEAEWEYGARGTGGSLFIGGNTLDSRRVNHLRSADPFETFARDPAAAGGPTTPAGYYDGGTKGGYRTLNDRSPFGMADMIGNVWEWCGDYFDPDYYAAGPAQDPQGPETGTERSVRGGAWNTPAGDISITSRGFYRPAGRSFSIGMRPARTRRQKE
jgi:formylglycine-generating enzyme required for sulfatase activity